MNLQIAQIAAYLTQRFQTEVKVLRLRNPDDTGFTQTPMMDGAPFLDVAEAPALKTFGYGKPILVECLINGKPSRLVLQTAAANSFGHDWRADRAAEMLLSYDTYNSLPHHTHALDVGVITTDDQLISLAEGDEFFVLTDYVSGEPYARDLIRLRDTGEATGADLRRARQLALYLAEIHSVKHAAPALYARRIRDTVGSGEGIMGLADSYAADNGLVEWSWLEEFEKTCVTWRWRLKNKTHRLAQVHGDFHPYHVFFERSGEFHVVDRSRGAWGEPADDVACMAINYLFFSLQRSGWLASPFEQLWNIFWNTYLTATKDHELLTVVPPFFAWRALVLASPTWYNISDAVRYALLGAARAMLQTNLFNPADMNAYLSVGDEVMVDSG